MSQSGSLVFASMNSILIVSRAWADFSRELLLFRVNHSMSHSSNRTSSDSSLISSHARGSLSYTTLPSGLIKP